MFNLEGSPYIVEEATARLLLEDIEALEERVSLLRRQGVLTPETLQKFYGMKRFEHVAESNAIEGSTLSVGETELAVVKGITITGHDPHFVRDAIALDRALLRLAEMGKDRSPTDINQIKEIHSLILGGHPSAGLFRKDRVAIKGSKHIPPKTWGHVMTSMESFEQWSVENARLPAIVRATVLHAWFVHIHPFIDGNGRTARAITNLELIRAGYPSIIIKKKERDRYIDALGKSDEGGDLSDFFGLIIEKAKGALRGLEQAANQVQGYSPEIEKLRRAQEQRLSIWNTSVSLLAKIIEHNLNGLVEAVGGRCVIKTFTESLELDDYIGLCSRHTMSNAWSFTVSLTVPGMPPVDRLAWFGYRSPQMYRHLERFEKGGPSIFWSVKNPEGYPPWIQQDDLAPAYVELTTIQGSGDDWYVMDNNHVISKMSTTKVAKGVCEALVHQLTCDSVLPPPERRSSPGM